MKILFDTSVLVASIVEAHPEHAKALPWLARVENDSDSGFLAAHSLAELYAILTTLPVRPSISPAIAWKLIAHITGRLEVIFLSAQDYAGIIERLAELGITGGATYDALITRAAIKANVDLIVTLNPKDFHRVSPELADKIISP